MSEVIIKNRQGIFVFQVEDIVYMEKNLRKICLHARIAGGQEQQQIEFYGRFAEIVTQLDDRFMHCHRSYVINMDEIVWMRGCEIFIMPNTRIHMGKDTYGRARRIFEEYLRKKYPEKTLKNTKFFL